jgi:Raf kinase inhibitor-like YbhB/YbcL family protein
MGITLSSTAFNEGEKIPSRYTCDGENFSPPLSWDETPASTKAFALIVDDPDAPIGSFTHWVIYNIPATARQLREGIPGKETLEDGTLQGKNDTGQTGYFGPCPPSGIHRYIFTIYALDAPLTQKAGASLVQLINAMNNHILDRGQLTGKYQRQ